MIYIFYTILFILIINEFLFIFNRKRLNINFKNKNIEKVKFIDVHIYLVKTISIFWPIIGLFSSFYYLFGLIIILNISKFIIYHINILLYSFYIYILPFLIVIIYSLILYRKLFQIIFCYYNKLISFFLTPLDHDLPFLFILISHFHIIFETF